MAKSWSPDLGCTACGEQRLNMKDFKPEEAPFVLIGIFVPKATPFMPEFFEDLTGLRYPRSRLGLFIHNRADYHKEVVDNFVKSASDAGYGHVVHLPNSGYSEAKARELGL